ncbi:MAG TPA: hypothetical protein DER09_02255 [Prolixibacteraceae bacterium]|nr:hypothetical protein [Prolixibacteraceae bacterium]
MLRTNEKGEIITIENVFHSLTTRLSLLKNGLNEWSDLEYDFKTAIKEIESQIYGHESSKALPFVSFSKNSIKQIEESGKNVFRNLSYRWGYSQEDEDKHLQDISNEINYYSNSLHRMEEELLEIESQSVELFALNSSDKIPINITIPKLSWLIHFMVGDNKEFDKLFESEKMAFCRGLITILKKPNGDNISIYSIYNKWTDESEMETSLKFWRDRFGEYRTKCVNKLIEKGMM